MTEYQEEDLKTFGQIDDKGAKFSKLEILETPLVQKIKLKRNKTPEV